MAAGTRRHPDLAIGHVAVHDHLAARAVDREDAVVLAPVDVGVALVGRVVERGPIDASSASAEAMNSVSVVVGHA
jgi:hypothetical protein